MDKYEISKVSKSRDYLVVKSNDLVLQTRYQFSMIEQKTIAYVCSMIRPSEKNQSGYVLDYEFGILEYAHICGIASTGKLYDDVKRALKGLRDKSMWLTLPNGSETVVGWLDRVTTDKGSGKIKIRIDDRLAPYLFELQSRYLSYGLKNILCMKSQFSIRLYEMFRAYLGLQSACCDSRSRMEKLNNPVPYEWTIDIDELKRKLMVDNIKSYNSDNSLFRIKVLEPAQSEINQFSDISFDFEMLKRGRSFYAVRFTVVYKNMRERMEAEIITTDILDNEKITF